MFRVSFAKILKSDVFAGLCLALVTLVSVIIANTGFYNLYKSIQSTYIFGISFHHWINDGLMAIFFFYVGLEIKKEMVVGELNNLKSAALPFSAALGGMLVPALIYYVLNPNMPELKGAGIPMATDIAFALGVLAFFGKRIPLALKIFLLSIAIVDDLGAILVIAIFYTTKIHFLGLFVAFLAFLLTYFFKKKNIQPYWVYITLGIIAWLGFYNSGIHATLSGVIMGILAPYSIPVKIENKETQSPVEDLLHFLHPWISFLVMPVFAFFNAGINFLNVEFFKLLESSVFNGIVWGLFIGKPFGILLFSFVSLKLGLAHKSSDLTWPHILSVGLLAGIGFTMSLFIADLALPKEYEMFSKISIISASVLSGLLGAVSLFFTLKTKQKISA